MQNYLRLESGVLLGQFLRETIFIKLFQRFNDNRARGSLIWSYWKYKYMLITHHNHDSLKQFLLSILGNTYEVSRKTPSLQRSRAFLAAGLEANSTIPLPVERPRSSTITMALSTIPNWEKASSRSSFETKGERFFTDSAAECVAKRTRRGLLLIGVSSNSAFAISASARDSCKKSKTKHKQTQLPIVFSRTSGINSVQLAQQKGLTFRKYSMLCVYTSVTNVEKRF